MANLVRPWAWGQQKPPPGSTINWGHPLARGLIGCWLMNQSGGAVVKDLAGVADLRVASGDTTSVWQPAGFYTPTSGVGLVSQALSTRYTQAPTWAGCTFLWKGTRLLQSDTNAPLLDFNHNGTNSDPYVVLSLGTGTTGADIGIDHNQAGTLVRNVVTTQTFPQPPTSWMLAWRYGVRIDAYKNGGHVGQVLSNVNAPQIGSLPVININGHDLGGQGTAAVTEYSYIWNRCLSGREAEWLAAEPYCFIKGPGA